MNQVLKTAFEYIKKAARKLLIFILTQIATALVTHTIELIVQIMIN